MLGTPAPGWQAAAAGTPDAWRRGPLACEAAMILAWSVRGVLDRLPQLQRNWRRWFDLVWEGHVLPRGRTEAVRRFCPGCDAETVHDGFDEGGLGWYAQLWRCRHCGREGVRIWALGQW